MAPPSESDVLRGVKHIILVLSGKGGVGKSTVAVQLAFALKSKGHKVGILDVDLCGPSIPKMLNLEGRDIHQCSEGWVPVYADSEQRLSVMSIGFLLNNRDDAVVWRGPKKNDEHHTLFKNTVTACKQNVSTIKNLLTVLPRLSSSCHHCGAMIKQFLTDVYWGDLDYLIFDTPPGTSDEHISVVENIQQLGPDGAVLVTTPQAVAVGDVRRELTFCKKTGISVLGIVENMSGFVCPCCSEVTNIFSKGGGQALAENSEVPFLGCIPLDPQLVQSLENGQNFLESFPQSPVANIFHSIAEKLTETK